jgi:hypothetical protein
MLKTVAKEKMLKTVAREKILKMELVAKIKKMEAVVKKKIVAKEMIVVMKETVEGVNAKITKKTFNSKRSII